MVKEHMNPDKTINYDICCPPNEEVREVLEYYKKGTVSPSVMWGCKLCKKRLGKSDFATFIVKDTDEGDVIFCTKHGFLKDELQTFRRKRPMWSTGKRGGLCR